MILRVYLVAGSFELPIRGRADPQGVLQGHPGRPGCRAVLEEVHLQDHLQAGRPSPGVLQISQLPRTTRVTGLRCPVQVGCGRQPVVANRQRLLVPRY